MAEKGSTSAHLPSSDDPASFVQQRRQGDVRIPPFAGRIGGNQEFVASGDDEDILKKQPDAVRKLTSQSQQTANIDTILLGANHQHSRLLRSRRVLRA